MENSISRNDNPNTTTTTTTTTINSLNDFPEHLLLHILSFLPTIDAIKTTSISRRWRNLWSSIPILHFSYDLFPPSDYPSATRRRFADAVNQTLILRHPSPQSPPPLLTSFRLQFDFKEYQYSSLIKSWIRYAVNHRVLNLDIDFFIDRRFHIGQTGEEPDFEFPFYALRDGEVRVLKLSRCDLILPMDMSRSGIEFASLRSVFFDQIYLTDEMVSDLLNGCPNIEEFTLDYCWGIDNIKIRGMKIKTLSLMDFHETEGLSTSVVIDCPNLRVLNIVDYEVGKYTLKNASALVEATVWFSQMVGYYDYWSNVVKILGHVRKLTVQNWWFKLLLEQKDVFSESIKFHNLRWLELQTQYSESQLLGIAALLELSPNLDTLILDYLYEIEEDESISEELLNKPIHLSLPRLRQAKLKAFTATENELLFLSLLKSEAAVFQKIVVVPIICGVSYPPVVCVNRPNGFQVQQSSPHVEEV